MPPRKAVNTLGEKLKGQLDAMLRGSDYGSLVRISGHLLSVYNVKISKSALGRYAQELKARDAVKASTTHGLDANLNDRTVKELLAELGYLRIREHSIIKQLEQIGFIDKKNFG